jgi:hypothetical protein
MYQNCTGYTRVLAVPLFCTLRFAVRYTEQRWSGLIEHPLAAIRSSNSAIVRYSIAGTVRYTEDSTMQAAHDERQEA